MSTFPPPRLRGAFRAAAIAFVPELGDASADAWERLEATVSNALGDRPRSMTRQLELFLRVVDALSSLRYRRSLGDSSLDQRVRLLHSLERAPLLLIRRGVWGLRTLVFMGHYTQPSVVDRIGYRARAAGWDARR